LKVLGALKGQFPPDAQPNYAQIHIIQHWRDYFPNAKECPHIIYLDIWPVQSAPIALIIDPAMCQEMVAEKNFPRGITIKRLAEPVIGQRNLTWFDGAEHRLWRSRLNPGFSMRNLHSYMGAMVDETEIFLENLKATTRPDGRWGSVFPLLPKTIDLTFDIIGKVVLDLHLNEQRNGPTELQSALRTLTTKHFFFKTLANLPKRLNPFFIYEEWRCVQQLRKILIPRIKQHIGAEQTTTQKTVLQLAMKEYINDTQGAKSSKGSSSQFVEDVFGQVRLFLFAGHDTTACILAWAFHYLPKRPDVLEKLRAEHDAVFGTDLRDVAAKMRQSPQLLNALPYTTAVAKEVMRLAPLAATVRQSPPGFSFTATSERDGTTTRLPAYGFALITGTAMMDYHPELWPRPDDFLPERFLAPPGDPLYPSKPGQWRPFESGPMNCIGQELSMIEVKLVLLFTVREVEIEPAFEEWDQLP
jgi:cytochrome P450